MFHFVNADLIAGGLSPLDPTLAARSAGRIMLLELDRLSNARENFAFETTLSGRTYMERLKKWKSAGYRIEIVFLRLSSASIALKRVADVPRIDVLRRFDRGWANFEFNYRSMADAWAVFDNSKESPRLIEKGS